MDWLYWVAFFALSACFGVVFLSFKLLHRKYVELFKEDAILRTENALLAIKNEELRSALDEARDRLEAIDAEKERETNDKKY